MKTLDKIKNTTDIVALKSKVKRIPEYALYAELSVGQSPEIDRLRNKQEMTLNDFLVLHDFIFEPVTNSLQSGISCSDAISVLKNGVIFGLSTLHDIAPRLATWYIDIICNPSIVNELSAKNRMLTNLLMLKCLVMLHNYFGNVAAVIISHHEAFSDLPPADESILDGVNEFRRNFVRMLSPSTFV